MTKMTERTITAMIGCTGHVGHVYIETFINAGIDPVILARSPEKVSKHFPDTQIKKGSMLSVDDVSDLLQEVNSVLLITPIGGLNDSSIELNAAKTLVEAAQKTGSKPHILYISQLATTPPSGVPLLDIKMEIEHELAQSGLLWSALRIGFYMSDVLLLRADWIPKGLLFFPLDGNRKFSFSSEKDTASLAAHLITQNQVLNRSMDVIESQPHSLKEIADKAAKLLGKKVFPSGSFPVLSILKLARPMLKHRDPVMYSKTFMLEYFNQHDYIGDSGKYDEMFENLDRTSMEDYLQALLFSNQ